LIGTVIGEYKVLSEIGRGGMGIVYLAEHLHLRQMYALKILPENLSQDESFINHFYTEARTMASLKHPAIVPVVYMGKDRDVFYLVMEYVVSDTGKPKNLQDLVRERGGKLPPAELERFLGQICDALAYAHGFRDRSIKEGIVHRDLKPANILIGKKGRVKLSDFGLAKVLGDDFVRSQIEKSLRTVRDEKAGLDETLTFGGFSQSTAETILGTYEYMSPEQKAGGRVDHRSDIFSLGVIIYNLLTGKKPAGKFKNPSEIDPAIPGVWDSVVEKCLQESPDDRFQDVGEIANMLKGKGPAKKRRIPAAALVAVGLAVIAAAFLLYPFMGRERQVPGGPAETAETARIVEATAGTPVETDTAGSTGRPASEVVTPEKEQEEDATSREAGASEEKYNSWYDRGIEKMLAADREQAIIAFERALQYRDTQEARDQVAKIKHDILLEEARSLAGMRKYREAVASYQKALDLHKSPETNAELRAVREEMEKEAREKKREELFRRHVVRAEEHAAQSRFKQAVQSCRNALKLKPENEEVKRRVTELQRMAVPVSSGMVLIPAGEFRMGSEGRGRANESPSHRVYLDDYYIGKHEVTNKEYERFDPKHRKARAGTDSGPVTRVSWEDAAAYCIWRTKREGLPEGTLRLPTEAEWEKAARGGASRPTASIGSPNAYGVYNMPGGAWEWCSDAYDQYYYSSCDELEKNPQGPSWATTRSVRDTALGKTNMAGRVTSRMGVKPSAKDIKKIGFRCVRIK